MEKKRIRHARGGYRTGHHAEGNSNPNTCIAVTLDVDSKPRDFGTSEERQFQRKRKHQCFKNSLRLGQKQLVQHVVDAVDHKKNLRVDEERNEQAPLQDDNEMLRALTQLELVPQKLPTTPVLIKGSVERQGNAGKGNAPGANLIDMEKSNTISSR